MLPLTTARSPLADDKAAHDRLLEKAHAFCASVASKYPVTFGGAPPVVVSSLPVHLSLEAVYDANEAAPAGKKIFVATISIAPPLVAGAKVSARVPPTGHRISFSIPSANFKLRIPVPSTVELDRFTLTEVTMEAGSAAPASAAPVASASAAPASAAPVASASAPPASASAASAPPPPMPPPPPPPMASAPMAPVSVEVAPPPMMPAFAIPPPSKAVPIPVPGTFEVTPVQSAKAPQGKIKAKLMMAWDDTIMYSGAKLSIFVQPMNKTVTATLPPRPSDGAIELTMTLDDAVGMAPFAVGPISITSGPKPATQPPTMSVDTLVTSTLATAAAATVATAAAAAP